MTGQASSVQRHASKVDPWLGIVIAALPVVLLVIVIALTITGEWGEALIGWFSLACVAALYVGLVWPVVYELHDNELVIRFGKARSRIPYHRISGVRPTRSLLASPALSLDRLAIDLGRSMPTTISPADRDTFLRDLAARVPQLRRDGDSLVAPGP